MPPSVTNCVPGVDRREPAARQEQAVQVVQREAGLGAQHAGRRVEREDAIGERRAGDDRTARRRQRRVAVRAAEAARQHGVARDALEVLRAELARLHPGVVAPAGDLGRTNLVGARGGRLRSIGGIPVGHDLNEAVHHSGHYLFAEPRQSHVIPVPEPVPE